jgi:hypothetical protein
LSHSAQYVVKLSVAPEEKLLLYAFLPTHEQAPGPEHAHNFKLCWELSARLIKAGEHPAEFTFTALYNIAGVCVLEH